ncbi:hypothetical protein R4L22_10275 [Brachyspira pilosicoli]|uniref:hypothetical protein n=1 Tax=Brachyspira pilosicoli TaxID=52584 RepID=UPI001E3CFF0B|nr:hypothetical protein [Brachyspira pilosicoli]
MKKLHILLVAIMLMLIACARPFDSRYYYNKKVDSSKGGNIDTTPETPPEAVDPNEDPFLNGDWNRPNYGGYDASKFKTWLFKASFQKDKLPIYTFFDDNNGRIWEANGSDWNNKPAQYYKGIDGENYADSSLMKADITDLTVYKYESENPLYSSSGYLPGRIDRFNFYSINGKAAIVTLKQYLIAVDTYSKFIFAYGEITKVETVFGGEKVPMGFEAIEKYAEKRPFFEYDPIGYVKDDGSVVLFEHYIKEFVASPTTYEPKIHLEFTNMAKHDAKGQGYSPYLPKKDLESTTLDEITVSAKSLKNISVKSSDGKGKWGTIFPPFTYTIQNHGYFTYGIGAKISSDANSQVEYLEDYYSGGVGANTLIVSKEDLQINLNAEKSFTGTKSYTVKNIKENDTYIILASSIYKYNSLLNYIDTDNLEENGSGIVATSSTPKVKLKYNPDRASFIIDSYEETENTKISFDNNFTIKLGESKDFTIRYKYLKGNDTVNGEEFEITYTLNFKSIK